MAKKLQVTGRGKAVYPHLNTADTKYKEEGEFHVKLEQDEATGKPLADQIDEAMKLSLVEAKKQHAAAVAAETDPKKLKKLKAKGVAQAESPPYSYDEDEGTYTFTFKKKASGVSKKTGKPWSSTVPMYDAKMNKLPEDLIVGGGSEIKVSFELTTFYTPLVGAGVSLRLEGVQVLTLVAPSKDAKSLGFGEEDGFETEPAPDAAVAKSLAAKPAAAAAAPAEAKDAEDEADDDDDEF